MPVYFVRAGADGPIKIGFTAGDVLRRIAGLRTACPSELIPLGTIDGDERCERDLHRRFSSARITGEWFSPEPSLVALIATARPIEGLKRRRQTLGASSTTSELIDRLGGTGAVASRLKVQDSTVSGWRTRGFPPWASAQLRTIAAEENIQAAEEIFDIKRPQRRRAAA